MSSTRLLENVSAGTSGLGLLFGGSYDYNQRGTDDIEPVPGTNDFGTAGNPDIRPVFFFRYGTCANINFYRHRYGFRRQRRLQTEPRVAFCIFEDCSRTFLDYGDDWIVTPSGQFLLSARL